MDDLSVLSLELLKCVPKLDAWNLVLWLMIVGSVEIRLLMTTEPDVTRSDDSDTRLTDLRRPCDKRRTRHAGHKIRSYPVITH